MNIKKISILFIVFILLNNCSFDTKTGIWGDSAKEKFRISELEKAQKEIISVEKIYSSESAFREEIILSKNIVLTKPKTNLSWSMPNLNYQNFLGNIYLSGIDNYFLKKKSEKINFQHSKLIHPYWLLEII